MAEAEDEELSDRLDRGEWVKAIYMGLPMEIRQDPEAPGGVEGRGFFSYWMAYLPFNGMFFLYEGSYPRALWDWLTMEQDEWNDWA